MIWNKESQREYRKKNKAKCNAWNNTWQKRNRKKVNVYRRKWYAKNKEKHKAYQRNYIETHPLYHAERKRKNNIYNKKRYLKMRQNPQWYEKYKIKHNEEEKRRYREKRKKMGFTVREIAKRGTGWETIRLKVLARDDCVCQVCGGEGREVHHIDGTGSNRKRQETNNAMENLITVCHKCHISLDLERLKESNFNKGRWEEETERNRNIVNLSKKLSQTKISKIYGISRQRVSQIIQKCKALDKRASSD